MSQSSQYFYSLLPFILISLIGMSSLQIVSTSRSQRQSRIDQQARPVDIASRRTAQEQNVVDHLLCGRGPSRRREALDDLTELGYALQGGLQHWGVRPGRTDGVDADLVLDVVECWLVLQLPVILFGRREEN